MSYRIPVQNLPTLAVKIETLSRKSVKISGQPITLTLGDIVRVKTGIDANLQPTYTVYQHVDCVAPVVRIGGWQFIATLDHLSSGTVIRAVPNLKCEIPESYRTAGPVCDHCGINRRRNDTFLIRNESSGAWQQIGRNCLSDYIGRDVTHTLSLAECVASVSGAIDEDDCSGGESGGGAYIHAATYLAHVAASIRSWGWVSRKDSSDTQTSSTADSATTNMFRKADKNFTPVPLIAGDFEVATKALAWAQALPGRSDFEHNMWAVANQEMVEYRSTGILAYCVPGMMRATEKAFAAATKKESLGLADSQHVGKVGDKLKHIPARLYGYNAVDGRYGTTIIYKFICDSGNVFNWFSSGGIEGLGAAAATNQQRVILAGTVKNHNEYRDEKQTILTRCKVQFVTV